MALRIGLGTDELSYALDLGLPIPSDSIFHKDPEIKSEAIWSGPRLRPAALLSERRGAMVRRRGTDGSWDVVSARLPSFDSMLTELGDPAAAPEVLAVREMLRSWRFYDQIRTDAGSPARTRTVGTRTPALAPDGRDLAAAIATIDEIGDGDRLAAAIDEAFPGTTVEVTDQNGVFDLLLRQPGLLRPLSASEVSDGTLRYLVWTAALLSPRPPAFLVLNEPENSLHPSLLPALARLAVARRRACAGDAGDAQRATPGRAADGGRRGGHGPRRGRARQGAWRDARRRAGALRGRGLGLAEAMSRSATASSLQLVASRVTRPPAAARSPAAS